MLDQLIGGLCIGLGSIMLLFFTGYLSGMNSMWNTIFVDTNDFQYRWKTVWLSTFIAMGLYFSIQLKKVETLPINIITFVSFFILAFGVRMGKGCTSGHGINGLARFSKRSLLAVPIFFGFAVLTASLVNLLPVYKTYSITKPYWILTSLVLLIWLVYAFQKTHKRDEDKKINYLSYVSVIFSALLFSYGLVKSGMFNYSIVRNTLNLSLGKKWSPKLLYVFGTAVIIAIIGYQLIFKYRKNPIPETCEQTYLKPEECKFVLPRRNTIDTKLIVGSTIFGIGWGLTGMCPSTFPIRLGLGDPSAFLGLTALFLGYQAESKFENITKLKDIGNETVIIHQFYDKPSFSFTYIIGDRKTKEVIILDSVFNKKNYEIPTRKIWGNYYYINNKLDTARALLQFCDQMKYQVKYLINSHIHIDHITANMEIKKLRYIPSIIGNYPDTESDFKYKEGDMINISPQLGLKTVKTPGHTENCHSFVLSGINFKYLFTGDCLLNRGIGRTDLESTHSPNQVKKNKEIMFQSLIKLVTEMENDSIDDDNIFIFPAHDYEELRYSNYRELKNNNQYIQLVKKFIESQDVSIKNMFINLFEKKEKSLATFDDFDINMCVDINKICGTLDNVKSEDLDRLWLKASGACG